jgi:hypothetical protein
VSVGDAGRSQDLGPILRRDGRQARDIPGLVGGRRQGEGRGRPIRRTNSSKAAGSATSRKRAFPAEVTMNVWGTPRGPYTNDPAGAVMTVPPTQKVSPPSVT